jgi:hypothetical protein
MPPPSAKAAYLLIKRGNSVLAIPVLRSRVAPVLNWCSTIHLFPDDTGEVTTGREIILLDMTAPERLRVLKREGVRTIVCGALSPDLLSFAEGLDLRIIHGIAGEIVDVLQAYRSQSLDLPCYWLPGCRGPRHYRRAWLEGCRTKADNRADFPSSRSCKRGEGESGVPRGGEKGRTGGVRSGPGGFCACPRCGIRAPHEQGIPCTQVVCSRCGQPMVRG